MVTRAVAATPSAPTWAASSSVSASLRISACTMCGRSIALCGLQAGSSHGVRPEGQSERRALGPGNQLGDDALLDHAV